MLDCEVFGDVRFHGVDSLGDRLLTKATFATQIGPQALLLTEPGAGAHGFVEGWRIGGGELRTQRSQGDSFGRIVACVHRVTGLAVMAFAHPHWNPIHLFMDFSS